MATGPHRVLIYDYVADVLERRAAYREAHLAHIAGWIGGRGMLSAGALGDPPTGALFVFGDVPEEAVAEFADGDPYRAAGLVTARRILPWTVVASA